MNMRNPLLEDAARAVHVPPHVAARLRFEARRKAFHVFGAIVAVPATLLLPRALAVGLAILGVVLIVVADMILERRFPKVEPLHTLAVEPVARALEETRRPGEGFPWSPVLFLVSLVVCALGSDALGLPIAYAFAAYGVLGLGDAASALVGVAYGRHRLPWSRRKSWEGTLAGLAGGFAAAALFAAAYYAFHGLAMPVAFLPVALAGATVGAFLETLPGVQDNLVVPVGAWATMAALGVAFGIA